MLAGARSWSPYLSDKKRSLARVFNRAFEPVGFIQPSSCWLCPFPSQVQQLAVSVSRMITNSSGGFSHLPCRADHSRWAVGCSPWATSYGHTDHPVGPTVVPPCISTPSKTQMERSQELLSSWVSLNIYVWDINQTKHITQCNRFL